MQKLWPPPKIQLMIKVHIHFGHVPIQEILKYLYYFFQVHGSHLLTSSYERFQSSPWILTLAVLIGSVGFTVLVLAFFLLQNRRICSRSKSCYCRLPKPPTSFISYFFWKTGRTYDSSDDMELVTNIIVNPNYQAENDRTLLTNEGHNDRQALLTCNFIVPRRPAVCLWNHFYTYSAFSSPDSTLRFFKITIIAQFAGYPTVIHLIATLSAT